MGITVCLLLGLPATGKTTLANTLFNIIPGHISQHCCLFSYDKLMPQQISFAGEGEESANSHSWKVHRSKVFTYIESCIRLLKGTSKGGDEVEFDQTIQLCSCFQDGSPNAQHHVIIVDDNLFYRSMRYVFYQLARKYECSFCQVFLQGSVDVLIERNRSRSETIVNAQTLTKMSKLFETPDSDRYSWEKYTVTLDVEEIPFGAKVIESITSLIQLCSSEVLQPVVDEQDVERREISRRKTLDSYCHHCDQMLRKLVSMKMSEAKSRNPAGRSDLKQMAMTLNERRKEYLELIRNGEPPDHFDPTDHCWVESERVKCGKFLSDFSV